MSRYRLLLVLIAMPVVLSGCSTAAKEAYYTVRGPQANVLVIRPVADTLAEYDSFTVEPIVSELEGVLPAGTPQLVQDRIAVRLQRKTRLENTGSRPIVIKGQIVYAEIKGIGGTLASPGQELVCHIALFDSADNLLGWAAIAGKTKSRVRGTLDEDALAEGVAKGVEEWLTDNGVPDREEDKE